MNDCIFCKIINKEIKSYKIYEDDYVYAFLDIENDISGHTLVVPKTHSKDLVECDDNTIKKIMLAVKKISKHFLKKGYDGVNIVSNCKEASGQNVLHFHIHILPRKKDDGAELKICPSSQSESIEKIALKLRMDD